jgi:hypothetical protein
MGPGGSHRGHGCTSRLEGHTDTVAEPCVLPDGRRASGSADNTIRLWNRIARLEVDTVVPRLAAGDGMGPPALA